MPKTRQERNPSWFFGVRQATIDSASNFAITQLVEQADRRTVWALLKHLLEAVPYRVDTILTVNVLCRELFAA